MSLADIKQKEKKGKKNVLPKLRTILANPYKQHIPVLPENEMLEFENILKAAITASEHTQKTFATNSHIQLGLDSSLRAINRSSFSCVFISLSMRPSHLVRLIATSAAIKIPTAPIYAQPKLEELTRELFGVRALTLVLPLDLNKISSELDKWISARKKAPVQKQKVLKAVKKRKAIVEELRKVEIQPQVAQPVASQKEWSGDYISCANDEAALKLDQVDVQTEKQQLGAALSNLMLKAQSTTKPETENTQNSQAISETLPTVEHMQVDKDVDEFLIAELSIYQPLTVHQIRANPDKKPKKKRNKKEKKQTAPNKTN
ncbi:uncharacterized protein LOC122322350 [Drosophila grimshawi]|uniref:GH19161 n=1 Tax=Drosophila grimshawi TaxID=7222 RepID=B4JEP6_DROGR|nr:uncharacterized protein LOC122322350 [Drosophila grimshawi]EDV93177.1 GH19161 [Drosophila grimshawi]